MKSMLRCLRYDWPLHFVLLLTNWLPDNVVFLRFRGFFASLFMGNCGKNLRLGRNIDIYNPQKVHVGSDVYIAYGCVLIATDVIRIENQVMLGPYCVIASGNHTIANDSFRYSESLLAPIRIGYGSWLGAHVVVTAGSVVGNGSLIAAGAVVNKNIPAHVLAGGIPARVLRTYE